MIYKQVILVVKAINKVQKITISNVVDLWANVNEIENYKISCFKDSDGVTYHVRDSDILLAIYYPAK